MFQSIDWPQVLHQRRHFPLILLLVLLAVIFIGGRTAVSYYVDALWFGSLGYAGVFWKTLRIQSAVFSAFAGATFLILYGSFLAMKRAPPSAGNQPRNWAVRQGRIEPARLRPSGRG